MGTYSLAVGYTTLFWPEFVEHKGYLLRKGFTTSALHDFEQQTSGNRKSVEWVLNHIHLADIQYRGCDDLSKDKLFLLGTVLKEIHIAKLQWQFPDRPCEVEFFVPEDDDELDEYALSFWQLPSATSLP